MADITQTTEDSIILAEGGHRTSLPDTALNDSVVFDEGCGVPEAVFTIVNPVILSYQRGSPITFAGSATFLNNALSSEKLVWHSDIDGLFLYGQSGTYAALSPGVHTITLMSHYYGGFESVEVTILDSKITGDIVSVEEDT